MSFVEDNKAWILPLLGLGAAAVIWLNVRTFNAPPAAPQEPLPPSATAPPAPPPAEVQSAPVQDESLWEDLRPTAFVPADLETRGSLEQQALSRLPPEAFLPPPGAQILRPAGGEPAPVQRRLPSAQGTTPAPAPPPDFLIEGPAGSRAWFDGQGYRPGQALRARPFTVHGIRFSPTPQVTLQGPAGTTTRSTRPAQEFP